MDESQIVKKSQAAAKPGRTPDLIIVAAFAILAGLAEVVTGFTHNFVGITTSSSGLDTALSVLVGLFYAASGGLLLTMKKWAARLAIALLIADILGRVALVLAGFYPLDSAKNTFSIVAGTLIVALVAIYTGWKWKSFK
jgi:hypothetical protein